MATSGYFWQDCYASAAAKGSGMSGDGSLGNPYDCLLEGLLALPTLTAGDLVIDKTGFGNYAITFQGSYAHTDVDPLAPDGATLTGLTPSALVTTPQEGDAATNERQHLALNGINEVGKFRLTWNGETTGWIHQNAYPSVAVKGSGMSGDGTDRNPYDCVQEALLHLSTLNPGDLAVTRTPIMGGGWNFDVTFQGTYANMDVSSLEIQPGHIVLWPSSASHTLTTPTPGGGGSNEQQRLSLQKTSPNDPTLGTFRLSWSSGPLLLTEVGLAMRWLRAVLEGQTALMAEVGNHVYQRSLPAALSAAPPPHAIVYQHNSNRDVAELGGNRLMSTFLIDVVVVAPEREPSQKTDRLARDLSNLLECYGPETTPEGVIGSCVRFGEVWVQETDESGLDWTRIGLSVEVNVERVP
jgi:hypothetical protein